MRPDTEEMLTIAPRMRCRIAGKTARIRAQAAKNDLEYSSNLRFVSVLNRAAIRSAGIVNQDIGCAYSLHKRMTRGLVRDIQQIDLASQSPQWRRIVGVTDSRNDVCTKASQATYRGGTNP